MSRRLLYTALSLVAIGSISLFSVKNDFGLGRNMEMMVNLMRAVSTEYVDQLDADKIMRYGADGIMRNLDPYCNFLSEQEMKDFLDTRVTSKFKIDELCRHISRSESQTIRIFKKAYGITPYTYVLGKKTDLAKKLLCDTNLSVREIADKLCFADEYYFSNVFKKRVGVTPSLFRKQESLKD